MNLRALTDDELVRHAYADLDELTTTDLERELLRRFEKEEEDTRPMGQRSYMRPKVARALLEVLQEEDITNPSDLRMRLLQAVPYFPNSCELFRS